MNFLCLMIILRCKLFTKNPALKGARASFVVSSKLCKLYFVKGGLTAYWIFLPLVLLARVHNISGRESIQHCITWSKCPSSKIVQQISALKPRVHKTLLSLVYHFNTLNVDNASNGEATVLLATFVYLLA